ncbi:MAG: hypothetical protein OEM93_10325 [Rhodospirillales bacterium]|nr:hypothetical protein [Rhodospirillales bacterium]
MALTSFLKALFYETTWSERPRSVSAPLQGTRFSRGKHLKRVWLHGDLARPPAERVYLGLGEIDISLIGDRRDWSRVLFTGRPREVQAEACRGSLGACLGLPAYDELLRSDCRGRLFRLDLAITHMTPGITALRVFEWLTLFGLGHACLQVEGILSEPRHGQVLMKFAARRRHSGLTAREDWWFTPEESGMSADLPKSMTGHLIRRISYDILMELDARLNTGGAARGDK